MSILTSIRCKTGHHAGQWSFSGSHCAAVRSCESCGTREQRTRHAWLPFAYVEAGRCDQVRRCERCGATQSRRVHVWGPWFYRDNELNTPQVHTCTRCHESERTAYTMR